MKKAPLHEFEYEFLSFYKKAIEGKLFKRIKGLQYDFEQIIERNVHNDEIRNCIGSVTQFKLFEYEGHNKEKIRSSEDILNISLALIIGANEKELLAIESGANVDENINNKSFSLGLLKDYFLEQFQEIFQKEIIERKKTIYDLKKGKRDNLKLIICNENKYKYIAEEELYQLFEKFEEEKGLSLNYDFIPNIVQAQINLVKAKFYENDESSIIVDLGYFVKKSLGLTISETIIKAGLGELYNNPKFAEYGLLIDQIYKKADLSFNKLKEEIDDRNRQGGLLV